MNRKYKMDVDRSDSQMFSSVELDVLEDLLVNGDNTPKNIAENREWAPVSVSQRLAALEEQGLVENKGSGVWTLTVIGANTARSIYRSRRKEDEGDD